MAEKDCGIVLNVYVGDLGEVVFVLLELRRLMNGVIKQDKTALSWPGFNK